MQKCIIVLSGVSEGKTIFVETVKKNNYWTWNINPKNVLSRLTHSLCWNGERNKHYYEFIDEFMDIANKYWDFENQYVSEMIEKFNDNEKAQVLIIHSLPLEKAIPLQANCENVYSINVTDGDYENTDYCKALNYRSDDFCDKLLEVIKILTSEKEAK